MDKESTAKLVSCLLSEPPCLPTWFRYDLQGSIYFDQMVRDSPRYYLSKSEIAIINLYMQEMVDQVTPPCDLVDMGSGNSIKTRKFIDAMLERQSSLTYIPVDISADFLKQTCESIAQTYGNKLNVKPIPAEYKIAINKLKTQTTANKLILWLGSFINVPEGEQVPLMTEMADTMTDKDRLLMSLDLTNDKEIIEKAYLDDTDTCEALFLNSVWRLNREFGSNIDTNQFFLEVEYSRSEDNVVPSRLMARIVAKTDQTHHIPGLGVTMFLKKGDFINLFDNDGGSFKYTLDQVRNMADRSGLCLDRYWLGEDKHAALCCFRRKPKTEEQRAGLSS